MQLKRISVAVISYNHEKYIRQCLESIIQQKGSFELQVVLAEDCSTDSTLKIMQEYQQKYPDIFNLLPSTANLGVPKNLKRCLDACTGDYIALLDGDDYWTDSRKLEKQLELLESHPEYSMCFNALVVYFDEESRYELFPQQVALKKEALTTEDLLEHNYVGNASCCMYRTDVIRKLPAEIFNIYIGDWIINMFCGRLGKIGFLRDWMTVYRKHDTGTWSNRPEMDRCYFLYTAINSYNKYFSYQYDEQFRKHKEIISKEFVYLYEKQFGTGLEGAGQSAIKKGSNLILRAIRNPRAAFKVLLLNTLVELNKYQGTANTIPDLTRQNVFNRLVDRMKRYGSLLARAIKNPGAALKVLRAISLNIKGEMISHQTAPDVDINIALPWSKDKKVDLLILDTLFPHPLSRWRLEEFCCYLDHFNKSMVLTTGGHLPACNETRPLSAVIKEFEGRYPRYKGRTEISTYSIGNYDTRLAYTLFMNNTLRFLKSMEMKKIPFVFTLYPGGEFLINKEHIICHLQRIFISSQFRKVIVTQPLTYDYLIDRHLCTEEQMEYIYGGVMPAEIMALAENYPRKFYGFEKNMMDICFVAFKYMEKGIDKGYDVFIETAKKLAVKYDNIRFHVVGTFDEKDIPIDGLEGKITFYGLQSLDWFDSFYLDKDIIMSPNVPFILREGAFDGFPTASCIEAGLRKVAVFCTDELKFNKYFTHGQEMVIIPHDVDKIVLAVEEYYQDPAALKSIGEKGALRLRQVFSYENQVLPRIKVLEGELNKELLAGEETSISDL